MVSKRGVRGHCPERIRVEKGCLNLEAKQRRPGSAAKVEGRCERGRESIGINLGQMVDCPSILGMTEHIFGIVRRLQPPWNWQEYLLGVVVVASIAILEWGALLGGKDIMDIDGMEGRCWQS